jgi:hypothetical protein
MTDDERQILYDNYETQWLLEAVDQVDILRDFLNDGANRQPPAIRTELLQLHQLAMAVINDGGRGQAEELFDRAEDLDAQVSDMMTELEKIQDTLAKLVALRPESLDDDTEQESPS